MNSVNSELKLLRKDAPRRHGEHGGEIQFFRQTRLGDRTFEDGDKIGQNKISEVSYELSLEKHDPCFIVSGLHCFSFQQPGQAGQQAGWAGSLEQRSPEGETY